MHARSLLLLCLAVRVAAADAPALDQVVTIPALRSDPAATREDVLAKAIDHAGDDDARADALLALAEHHARRYRKHADAAVLKKAREAFAKLTDDDRYANYARLDVALFESGYVLQLAGDLDVARKPYERLIKELPQSAYVPEAYLALAEAMLAHQQLADGEAFLKQVLKFPRTGVYWYAMYRMGDVHVALQRYQEALETYFQVTQAASRDPALASLSTAARHGFVVAYAEIGKADKALAAFGRVDNTSALDMLIDLAGLYVGKHALDKAAYTYETIIGSLDKADRRRDDVLAAARRLARTAHDDGTKNNDTALLEIAIRLYQLDGANAPKELAEDQAQIADARWAAADAHPDGSAWERAAVAYDDVVKLGKLEPKRVTAAARSAAVARRHAVEHEPTKGRVRALAEAIDAYAKLVKPADPDLVELRVAEGGAIDDIDARIPILADVVAHHRDHAAAGRAAVLLLDAYARANRTDDLHALAADLRRDEKFLRRHPEVGNALDAVP